MKCKVCGIKLNGELNGKHYIDGIIADGWITTGEKTYYFVEGVMITGAYLMDGKLYVFGEDGVYDPEGQYTVPYAYGIIGVIYNANQVDAADVGSWDLLWNSKYADKILQFNNSRDAFGMAMYKNGLDVNSTDPKVWDAAYETLLTQRPLVYSLVMDEIFNMMQSGEAAIGAYYAGDYFTMADAQAEDVDLKFYYPETTNYYIDAMCIPTCCENKELAEIFINYMCSEEPAVANAEYTYYASPNRLVYENAGYIEEMGEEAMDVLYSHVDDFAAQYEQNAYRNLPAETLDYINTLWETLKIN
jgi:spermidine/putrescine transport system substrate-binding protein